ncbi:Tat binding protein 1-interacting protein-domain-containing protein, partial [Blyttiomyces helicus]
MAKPTGKKPVVKGDGATDMVLKYLKKQNRPYSAVDVFNNLNGEVAKASVAKILTDLVASQQLHGKQNGKQWVYVARQDELETPTAEALGELDGRIASLKEDVDALKLEVGLDSLTKEEIEARLQDLDEETAKLKYRLASLREGTQLMTKADKDRIEKEFDAMRKLWKKRKAKFREIWNTVTDSMPGNAADLMEEMGIETDE